MKRLALTIMVGAALAGARADETWRLDNLRAVAGHPLTVLGAPRADEAGAIPALRFDGAHDGIFVPAIPIAGAKAFTIEVRFSPAADAPAAQRFFHLQDAAGARALIEIRTSAKGWWLDTYLWTGRESAPGTTLIDPQRVHPAGPWYWVALRFDGRTMTSFVNGRQELQGEVKLAPFGDGQVSLGVRQNKVYWFKGAIAEVRFHDAALPAEKLQRIEGTATEPAR